MNWKQHLPDIFLGISLGMIGIEAALASASLIKARYRARDTFASLAMQAGIHDCNAEYVALMTSLGYETVNLDADVPVEQGGRNAHTLARPRTAVAA